MSLYDLIGDIHANATALRLLLESLGYRLKDGAYQHPDGRKAIYIGDLPDRGDAHAKTFSIVRPMVEQGHALAMMGNHELNAIAIAMESPDGAYVRPRTQKNLTLCEAFAREYPLDSHKYMEWVKWFRGFPVLLELPDFQAVHACMDARAVEIIKKYSKRFEIWGGFAYSLTDEGFKEYANPDSPMRNALDILLKGPEIDLPPGVSFKDKQNVKRTEARILWWQSSEDPVPQWLDMRGGADNLNDEQIHAIKGLDRLADCFCTVAKPTFIGHYSLLGHPRALANPNVIGLDFRGHDNQGGITAYRLTDRRFNDPKAYVFQPYSS